MTKTLKDWPSNCDKDFFDALPAAGSKTFLDFSKKDESLYYARCHDSVTNASHVLPEACLGGFLEFLESDFQKHITGNFLGLLDNLEHIWWPEDVNGKRINPAPEGIVAAVEEEVAFFVEDGPICEIAKIVFYEIQKAPAGWVLPAEPGHFQVKPVREWILDYTFAESESEEEPSEMTDADPFPAHVTYRNQVFDV